MKIGIIGAGFVGLCIGCVIADKGHEVILVDVDKEKVEKINSAIPPFHENGLKELLEKHAGKRLKATVDYTELEKTEIDFICVGTPSKENGEIELKYLKSACESLSDVLKNTEHFKVVIVKSTVVPTTTEKFVIPILEKSRKKEGKDFGVCVNPEFLREGFAIFDFLNQDRIVIGSRCKRAEKILEEFYSKHFPNSPIVKTDLRTAEMIKYASNAFLATKISFINEIGNICKKLGIDVYKVVEGMKYDPRIGEHFLNAGIGYGGSCLPKDVKALITFAAKIGAEPKLLKAVDEVNERQAEKLVEIAKQKVGELKGKKIAVLGLSFKAGTNDTRETRSLPLIVKLIEEGAEVVVYDPVVKSLPEELNGVSNCIKIAESLEEAVKEAEIIKIATDWEHFKELEKMENLEGKLIFEGRRLLNKEEIAKKCAHIEGVCW